MKTELTRRRFSQGMSALAGTALLSGCGSSDEEYYFTPDDSSGGTEITIPADEKVYAGCMGNNCGGRCALKAHVRNGVIKRLTTDDRPDKTYNTSGDYDPQQRACLRCRSKRSMIYHPSRLMYPLRRNKNAERGDPGGFERITWQEAFKEIADQLKDAVSKGYTGSDPNLSTLAADWGKATLWAFPGTGDVGVWGGSGPVRNFFKSIAGTFEYRTSMLSYPGVDQVTHCVVNARSDAITTNARIDIMNARSVVLWGENCAESIHGPDTTHLLRTARDRGIPITFVDHYVTRTSKMIGTKHLSPVGGTDTALVCAMLYHMLKKHIEWCDINSGAAMPNKYKIKSPYFDYPTVVKAVHGFFDLPTPSTTDFYDFYQGIPPAAVNGEEDPYILEALAGWKTPATDAATAAACRVSPGASFSAYIFGDSLDLITAGLNYAPSVYPKTIGYDVNGPNWDGAGAAADELYDKRVPIYGQMAKTPEWAEKITGVPAADIEWFAEHCAETQPTFWIGYGMNRTYENEQPVWATYILAAVVGSYGKSGSSFGKFQFNETMAVYMPGGASTHAGLAAATAASKTLDNLLTNFNRMNDRKFTCSNSTLCLNTNTGVGRWVRYNKSTAQPCAWADMAEFGGTGISRWNNSEVKYCPPLKAFYLIAGNPVNQIGQNELSMDILKQKDSGGNYKLPLVVCQDIFMTPTAQHSDYVLPAQMPFERENLAASTYGGAHLYYINKVIEAPGETMNDLDILEGVANAYGGQEIKNYVKGGKRMEQLTKDGFQRVKSLAGVMGYKEPDMTFDEFKDIGVISWQPQPGDNLVDADFKNFLTLIETNGLSGRALDTTTGKFEAYSLAMTEDYEARRFYNFDDEPSRYGVNPSDLELVNIGQTFVPGYPVEGIYSKSANYDNNKQDNPLTYTAQDPSLGNKYAFQPNATSAALTQNMKSARFVYPIPMYIPLFEGRHACDNSGDYMLNGVDMRHPDPLNLSGNYALCMGNYHSIFRSHSTGNINPYANETYKRGDDGNFTFPDGATDAEDIRKNTGVYAWHLGVYEPLFISYADADANGDIKTGDTLMVSSPRASGIFTAEVTKTMRPGVAVSGEGSWTCFRNCDIELEDGTVLNNEKVDLGGSANTLSTQRPSRICQGSSYGTYQRIKIRKIKSIQLAD